MGLFDFLKKNKTTGDSSDPASSASLSDTSKTIAIGEGQMTIKLPENLTCILEDNQYLVFYLPGIEYVTGRISVITATHKTKPDEDLIFNDIPRKASEKGVPFQENGKVRYFEYTKESEESGSPICLWFMEAGYDNHIIITSITIDKSASEYALSKQFLDTARRAQFTIDIPDPKTGVISDLTHDHQKDIAQRVHRFCDKYSDSKTTSIKQLDAIVARMPWDPEDQDDWLDLGLVFGDTVRKEIEGFCWKLLKDEYGLTYCLNYYDTSIRIFPMTMFSKRKEDNTPFRIVDIYNGLLDTVGDMAKKGY